MENRKIKNFIKMKDSGIPENIFENVYVVSNIKEALTYKKEFPNCCFLTKQGEVFFPDGFIKTGKKSNILQKKRLLEQLKEEKNDIAQQIESLQQEIIKKQIMKEENKKKLKAED
ncbi:hypothetical protein THER_1042 [Thermodesulfovibrio sp. N1]|uniref:hypothetical protein n=1 Tax=Thermodesulfovibrio sp. N1 TaxID=1871110 RepID=UPI0008553C9E|nr:hypothetical protein [Thermodesulfovibrio sp. N1]ODA44203.1 hypothetical protein THER_1042 [Thermodesulfovibrio sp. N1]